MFNSLPIQSKTHYPQLDGLRGIAILLVMMYHFFPGMIVFRFGWSGVDLFFVLSGFLITGRLMPFLDNNNLLLTFYRNRFLRIGPLYFGFLFVFFITWFFCIPKTTSASIPFYHDHWWQFFIFIQNWIFINNVHEIKIHLQHLWSIAVEEQIYLVFPIFLLLVRNKKLVLGICLFLFLIIPLCRYLYLDHQSIDIGYKQVFWNTFFRLDAFLAGVLIYFFHNQLTGYLKYLNGLYVLGLICFLSLLTWVIISGDAEKNNPFIAIGGYSMIAIMYASLLAASISSPGSFVSRLTSLSFLKFTGKISYGLYIIHWPVLLVSYTLLNKLTANSYLNIHETTFQLIAAAGSIIMTYLLAYLSYRFYESWFLKRKVSPQ